MAPLKLAVLLLAAVAAAATPAPDGSTACGAPIPGLCHADASAVLKELHVADAGECCAACTADYACAGWTMWTSAGSLLCHAFRSLSGGKNVTDSGCVGGVPGARAARPNFIFVFPDTLRAESFGSYGNPLNVTPNLDRFAQEGTRFEQAHVMHTQCSPSRCTMMTGRYMHVSGHRTQTHLVQGYESNYFRSLKEAGYSIYHIGKNDMFSPSGLNTSVSYWKGQIGYPSGSNAFKEGEAGFFSFLNTGANSSGADPSINADYANHLHALEILNSNPPEPFVIFLTTRGAHPPYGAPKEWHNKFPVDEVRAKISLRPADIPGKPTFQRYANGIPHFRNLTTLDDSVFYKIQSVYLGMIAYTDWIFGQLLEGLAQTKYEANTAVFFSSDHGDFGGDHHLVEKWPGSMDDVLTRVPLFARIPGGAKGHVVKAPVQTADVLETMLDMAGVNASWVRFGKSLKTELAEGAEGDLSRFVFSEGGFYFENEQMIEANECMSGCPNAVYCPRGLEEAQPNGSPRAVMIRNLTAKLVARPTGISELYDLSSDPRELNNLYLNPAHATLRQEMSQQLMDWLILTSDITPVRTDPRGFSKYPNPIDPGCDSNIDGPAVDEFSREVLDYLTINGVY